MYAFACILSYDWMNGISLPPEPIDSLTTMVGSAEISESQSGKKKGVTEKNYLKSLVCHDSLQNSHMYHSRGNHNMPTTPGASSSQSSPSQGPLSGPGSARHGGTKSRWDSKRQRGNGS